MRKKAKRVRNQHSKPEANQGSDFFFKNYTKTEDGFYVRNSDPSSSGIYDDKRLIANIRSLLQSAVANN